MAKAATLRCLRAVGSKAVCVPVIPWKMEMTSAELSHLSQTANNDFSFPFFLFFFLGEDAAPHVNPHLSARVSVPGMSTDNETQSLSSAHGDLDSSGTDTF